MAADRQERRRIVVDGSNIATEGRTVPSLAQLDEAIRSFLEEYQGFATTDVTVVVDASFGHRIDPSEVPDFEQALDHGEMVTPPAGALGRGDGFILRIAEKSEAVVLSNDSFQEFHAERPWLFEPGRLIGGKPVPGVGWVFTPRTPVRGARSRTVATRPRRNGSGGGPEASGETDGATPSAATKKAAKGGKGASGAKATKTTKATKAERATKTGKADKAPKPAGSSTKGAKATKLATKAKPAGSKKAAMAGAAADGKSKGHKAPDEKSSDGKAAGAKATGAKSGKDGPTKATGGGPGKGTKAGPSKGTKTSKAAKATKAAKAAKATKRAPGEGDAVAVAATGAEAVTALNDPTTFLNFVANHPVGSTLEGTVASFTSHGAHIDVDGMLCHVPLRGLGDPPPSRARQVLTKGETRSFVLVSVDAGRRRAALALPGLVPD